MMIQQAEGSDGQPTSQWQASSSSGLQQPSIWQGQPATSAPIESGWPTIPGPVMYAIAAPPPPALPQFCTGSTFDYLHSGYADTISLDQLPEPLFGGATGGRGPSRLDDDQGRDIEGMYQLGELLQQRRDDPLVRPAATVT